MLPRRSWPMRWNEFLPISMPITAISLLSFWDMACSFVFDAPCQATYALAGREHGRTIPLVDMAGGLGRASVGPSSLRLIEHAEPVLAADLAHVLRRRDSIQRRNQIGVAARISEDGAASSGHIEPDRNMVGAYEMRCSYRRLTTNTWWARPHPPATRLAASLQAARRRACSVRCVPGRGQSASAKLCSCLRAM